MIAAIPIFALLFVKPDTATSRPLHEKTVNERGLTRTFFWTATAFLFGFLLLFFTYGMNEYYDSLFIRDESYVGFLGFFSPVLLLAVNELFVSVPALMFLFAAYGIFNMRRDGEYFLPLFLLAWFLLIVFFGNTAGYVVRHLDVVIVPVCIASAYALDRLFLKEKIVALILLTYFVGSMIFFMYPMLSVRRLYNGEKRFALFVKEKTENNAVVIAMDDHVFIQYYGNRRTKGHPVGNADQMRDFVKKVTADIENGTPVYMIETAYQYDELGLFEKAVVDNFDVQFVGAHICEDYHRPELGLRFYEQKLFKLGLKQ